MELKKRREDQTKYVVEKINHTFENLALNEPKGDDEKKARE